jgi:peptidoglycan glycosyltransferase
MNAQISKVAVFALALIVALIVATTYWQTWAAAGLADRQENAIQRVAQFKIDRGRILASNGRTPLAISRPRRVKDQELFFRAYPNGRLAPHVVGYSTAVRSRAGVERSLNDFLTGANANLGTVVDTTLDKLRGTTIKGNDVVLTIDARAQRAAQAALGHNCGAVVAIEPSTGRVLVMASNPGFDLNLVEERFGQIERQARGQVNCRPEAPLLNRATNAFFIPGSTFKVVTAIAALESGRFTPSSRFNDPGYCEEYGKRVNNYDTSSPFGNVSLSQALQYSINSVFCNIGKALGPAPIVDTMKKLGFYGLPPLETPSGERLASGLYRKGKAFEPRDSSEVDPGRLAFGQAELQVTPMQMAMAAAAVANGGVLMEPHVVDRVVAPDGSTVTRTRRSALGKAMSGKTAAEVGRMMELVVAGGTGTAAQIPGVRVAGKTGTAETGRSGRNMTSFVSFAPADAPRVAIAVMLENQSGAGGTTAAPIAQKVMQALLGRRSNP